VSADFTMIIKSLWRIFDFMCKFLCKFHYFLPDWTPCLPEMRELLFS